MTTPEARGGIRIVPDDKIEGLHKQFHEEFTRELYYRPYPPRTEELDDNRMVLAIDSLWDQLTDRFILDEWTV